MWTSIKMIVGAVVSAIVSSFLSALRRKRQDEELKQNVRNEMLLDAEKVKNNALEKWSKFKALRRSDVVKRLREGKF